MPGQTVQHQQTPAGTAEVTAGHAHVFTQHLKPVAHITEPIPQEQWPASPFDSSTAFARWTIR